MDMLRTCPIDRDKLIPVQSAHVSVTVRSFAPGSGLCSALSNGVTVEMGSGFG
jgi:hypothetical protein